MGGKFEPPVALESERHVLACLLLDPDDLIEDARDGLRPADFRALRHRDLFVALCGLSDSGAGIDLVAAAEHLRQNAAAEHAPEGGWPVWLLDLMQATTSTATFAWHLRVVQETAVLRDMAVVGVSIVQEIATVERAFGSSLADFVARKETALLQATARTSEAGAVESIGACVAHAIQKLENPRDAVHLGVPGLDSTIGGMEPGNVLVLAARPSVGKSTVALQIAINVSTPGVARAAGIATTFATLEMGRDELALRVIANLSGVDSHRLRQGRVDMTERREIGEAAERAAALNLQILDETNPTVARIRSRCLRIRREHGLELLIVDYLQLMSAPGRENRNQEVGACSRGLKALAKDLEIPVIVVAQLNRAAEGIRPRLAHLRESGEIEQDADQVVMLWRDDQNPGQLNASVEKNRHGPCGIMQLGFQQSTYRIAGAEPERTTDEHARRRDEWFDRD